MGKPLQDFGLKITVHHQQRRNEGTEETAMRFWDPIFSKEPCPFPEHYKKVAVVTMSIDKIRADTLLLQSVFGTEDDAIIEAALEYAWKHTNSIDRNWVENKCVETDGPHRSSMIGDVFEVSDRFYVAVAVGFERLEVDNGEEGE